MTDRSVRKVDSGVLEKDDRNRFSEFLNVPSIVLLGNPGSGKSHLFEYFAKLENGKLYTARNFLNRKDESPNCKIIYIDALDESRARRNDNQVVDDIVRKLFEIKPEKVRISCRAADWLGGSDLQAFKDYFDGKGDTVVLALEPLSDEEKINVLAEKGIGDQEAKNFLGNAKRHRLSELAGNPQNLIMLFTVVEKTGWPSTLKELYENFVKQLLLEHNRSHREVGSGQYSPEELMDAAGSVCAIRLLGDIDGICLENSTDDDSFPSYRNVSIGDMEKVRSALGRRIFEQIPAENSVNYTHRTTAEFLAASWLSKKVCGGMPFGRIAALLGVDGRPTTELRGLNAWLAILLPSHAKELIDNDPFGVLIHGDAASLTLDLRKYLLHALAKLAEADPWFRANNWSKTIVAGLSSPDMEQEFRKIIRNKNSNFGLKTIVLDSLSAGQVIPGLGTDLCELMIDRESGLQIRIKALDALINLNASAEIGNAYGFLDETFDGFTLRVQVLKVCSQIFNVFDELTRLLNDVIASKVRLRIGDFWGLDSIVKEDDIPRILNGIQIPDGWEETSNGDFHADSEVVHVYDKLLVRYLKIHKETSGEDLLCWLKKRKKLCSREAPRVEDDLRQILIGNKKILDKVLEAALKNHVLNDDTPWFFEWHISEICLNCLDPKILLEKIFDLLHETDVERRDFFYQLGMLRACRLSPDDYMLFERFYEFANGISALEEIRSRTCVSEIDEYRIRRNQREAERQAEEADRKQGLQNNFEASREQIKNGMHLGWMAYIGRIYYGVLSSVSKQQNSHERLQDELGDKNASIALEGLGNLISSGRMSTLEEVIDMRRKGKMYEWWYGVLAGMEEFEGFAGGLDCLSDEYLCFILAIDLLYPVFRSNGNVSHQIQFDWKKRLIQARPELAVKTFLALSRSCLENRESHIEGFHELLHDEHLEPYRISITLEILKDFPFAPKHDLNQLFVIVLSHSDKSNLHIVAEHGMDKCIRNNKLDYLVNWVAFGCLVGSERATQEIRKFNQTDSRDFVWALRDIGGFGRYNQSRMTQVKVDLCGHVAAYAGQLFPDTSHPSEVWSGDQNPWDASDFIKRLVNIISGDVSPSATAMLSVLANNSDLVSYRDYIKHALANQQRARVDAEYNEPTWRQVKATLENQGPANIADLQALVLDHLRDIGKHIADSNTDLYKRFWNENSRGKIEKPKPEESGRDVLVDLMRDKMSRSGIEIQPEGHMARDRRCDITCRRPGLNLVVEIKKDTHNEVWSACFSQLDRFYTRDPEAKGHGVYVVFWYGDEPGRELPKPPSSIQPPQSASEMEQSLVSLIPPAERNRLRVVVLDVSGETPPSRGDTSPTRSGG